MPTTPRKEFFRWDDGLLTGVRVIDEQHKQLFEEANNLMVAVVRHDGEAIIGKFLDYLETYSKEHFASEDDLMQMYAYPRIEEHRREHAYFFDETRRMRQEIGANYTTGAVIQVATKIIVWMTRHIPKQDMPLVEHIRKIERQTAEEG